MRSSAPVHRRSCRAFSFSGSFLCVFLILLSVVRLEAQLPAARLAQPIDGTERVTMPHSRPPRAQSGTDGGAVEGGLQLTGMHLQFARTPAQEADLQTLLAAQQNPSSPEYHQWLTPEQFGARFGVADADIQKTEAWLSSQGFTVDSVSRSRNSIEFSGTAAVVAQAFGAPLHYVNTGGERNFAPSADLSLPASLAGITAAVRGLDSFRLKPSVKLQPPMSPALTSSQTGNHLLTPLDVDTIYDVKPLTNSGYNGAGQTIAVMGQSAVVTADITNFQNAAGLTPKLPTLLLVPNSGTSTLYSGDWTESSLDLEYSSGMAPGAQIIFVYTGSSQNADVTTALDYAIKNRVAPIISFSYGGCEAYSGSITSFEQDLAQAAAQGQTVIASSGDTGVEGCYNPQDTSLTTAQQEVVSVSYPASSSYVTGLGGTETAAAALTASTSGTTYWSGASGSDTVSSALQYLPEVAWNESAVSTVDSPTAGGGGVSTLIARPSWQAGVTGIPAGTFRLVPDISLQSSVETPGYVFCTSDKNETGITGSCTNGFRDANNQYYTTAGGTSFAAPIFAGMLAILNQATHSTGQGVINSTLYSLAANSTTYASVFHDITSGSNNCPAGVPGCGAAAASIYSAGTGYDEATGLGSIDLNNLVTNWPKSAAASLQASVTTLTPATANPAVGATDAFTIGVASASGLTTTVPTGTVTITVDGGTSNGGSNSTVTLNNGVAAYTLAAFTVSGEHTVVATYSGDTVFAASNTTSVITVGTVSSIPTGSFTLSGTALSVTAGSTGTSTITVTPTGGYVGTVQFTVTPNVSIPSACYSLPDASVTSTAAVTVTLKLATNATTCAAPLVVPGSGAFRRLGPEGVARDSAPALPGGSRPISLALAALGFGVVGWRKRRSLGGRALLSLGLLAVLIGGVSGCGGSSNASNPTSSGTASTGSYTLTITGTDVITGAITNTTTVSLTIH